MESLEPRRMQSERDVLFLSHGHWESDFVVGSQHLARELSTAGWRVLRVVTPLSPLHAILKRSDPGNSIRRWFSGDETCVDRFGVTNVRPATLTPVQRNSGSYGNRVLRRFGMETPRYVFVDQPLMLGRWIFDLNSTVIYRPTDIYLGADYRRLERRWLGNVDGVVATSEPVLDALDIPAALPSTVLRNGVDLRNFERVQVPWEDRRGVVYVGALDNRFDWDLLSLVARSLPAIKFTIAGPISSRPDVPSNVELLGPVRYEEVPSLLGAHRVALMPFSDAPENRGRSPMKLYECVAAGLSVVLSTNLGDVPRDLVGLISVYTTPDEAVTKVQAAHEMSPKWNAALRVAKDHGWGSIGTSLIEFAGRVEATRRRS